MDLGTILGVVSGIVLVLVTIVTGGAGIANYISVGSFIVVIGGSFAAMLVANPLSRMLGIAKYIGIALKTPDWQEEKIISELVAFSERARREGLLALEDNLDEVEDEFMRKGVQLVVDGTDPDIIKSILYHDLSEIQSRHQTGQKIFDDWGKIAPAFGMIGTLLGLIQMLVNLGGDQSVIGAGMAIALITTLYGALFANLILIPIRSKLEDRDKEETRVKEIILEGILSIQSGDNPRILLEKLVSFLPPGQREVLRQESAKD
ncbi:MAG: motility protein A [Spirochaetaceae bacterium]|nr:MAG: motility protein A [Spirochaetaceae bacterium]